MIWETPYNQGELGKGLEVSMKYQTIPNFD